MAKWSDILNILAKHNVPYNTVSRKNKIHIKKDELTDAARADLEKSGARTTRIVNPKMVQRPAYIQQDVDAVSLTPADATEFAGRGKNDMLTVPRKKNKVESDSLAIAIGDAIARHRGAPEYRAPTDEELYIMEGDIQGGGAGAAPRKLVDRFMNDPRWQRDVMNRLYGDLKASGANKDADALLANVKTRYGIDFNPDEAVYSPEYGKTLRIDDVQGIAINRPQGLVGDIYNENNKVDWYKITWTDEAGQQHVDISPWASSSMIRGAPYEDRFKAGVALNKRAKQMVAELPRPIAPATELTEAADIAEHSWYPMTGNYAHPLGFISEDGKYFVGNENALPLNFRHYRTGGGPYKLR